MMQVDRAKSAFLSRMSHELRTPLNSILGFGQLLEIGHPRDDQVEALEQIQRAGHHLLDLLNDLLEFERIRSGHVTFSIEPVNVAEAIDDALRLVEPAAQTARVTLLVDPAGATLPWASCDRQRFHQVLLNILSNAIKYNVPGGTVTVSATSNGTITSVGVTDTGTGIEPSQLANLFVPFERLGADARAVEGAGVGLALSKMLTEGMGGKISVASTPGKGSTFTVSLHAADPVEAIVEVADNETARAQFGDELRSTKVLYIEDNDANVRLVEAMLQMFGVREAFSATTGEQGVAIAARERPDVILLDLHLPDLPGEQVLRRLRATDAARDVPVIVVTADANPGTSRRLLNAGVSGFITKPVGVSQLFDALVDAVKVKRALKAQEAARLPVRLLAQNACVVRACRYLMVPGFAWEYFTWCRGASGSRRPSTTVRRSLLREGLADEEPGRDLAGHLGEQRVLAVRLGDGCLHSRGLLRCSR